MTIVFRGNRIQCMNSDVGSLPTTGVTKGQIAEVCDTNVWMAFNGSSWITLGTNTLSPLASVPGDVNGLVNSSQSPNGPFWWNSGGSGIADDTLGSGGGVAGGLGTGSQYLPFQVTTSKTANSNGYLAGQRLFELDTGNSFRWDGEMWQRDQTTNAAVGSTSEKGGGTASITIGTTTQSVFNIPHGIGAIPSIFLVTPANAAAAGGGGTATNTLGFSVTANATNIIVTYQAGILSTSSPVNFNWLAID